MRKARAEQGRSRVNGVFTRKRKEHKMKSGPSVCSTVIHIYTAHTTTGLQREGRNEVLSQGKSEGY